MPKFIGEPPLTVINDPALYKAVGILLSSPSGAGRVTTEVSLPGGQRAQVVLQPYQDHRGARKVVLVFHPETAAQV